MELETLTAFDIGVLILIGLSTILAFGRGFTTVALSFVAWAAALFITVYGFNYVQLYGQMYIQPDELADLITIVAMFLLTLFILKLMADFIGGLMKDGPLGFLDRSLGALFGMLRGIVIVSALFLAFTRLFPGTKEPVWMSNAQLRPLVAWGAEMLEGFSADALGKDPKKVGADYVKQARDSIKSGFNEENLEKLAPIYKKAQKKALEDLLKETEDKTKDKDDDGT